MLVGHYRLDSLRLMPLRSEGHQCSPVGNTAVTKGGPSLRLWSVGLACSLPSGGVYSLCLDIIICEQMFQNAQRVDVLSKSPL